MVPALGELSLMRGDSHVNRLLQQSVLSAKNGTCTRYKRSREKSKINSLVTHIPNYVPGRRGGRDGSNQGRLHRGDDRLDGFLDGEGAGHPDKGSIQETLTTQDHKLCWRIYLLLPTTVLRPKVITMQKTSCRIR